LWELRWLRNCYVGSRKGVGALYGIQIGLETAFLRSRIVVELLCGLQAWLINSFFLCVFHGRFGTVLWVPRLVLTVFWNVRLV